MAGAGHPTPIKDINRITSIYGGYHKDWAKMTSKSIIFPQKGIFYGKEVSMEVHWYENIQTKQKIEFKAKIKSTIKENE